MAEVYRGQPMESKHAAADHAGAGADRRAGDHCIGDRIS